ncbi:MAG: lamin tail domain-containing protein [Ignavibacteriales bacterium]|nr:lamin tail domain-containing protein [Ignavibacteriales bacterium]
MARSSSDSTLFRVTLGSFSHNDYVRYYVEAVAANGASEVYPSRAEYVTQSFVVSGTNLRFPVVINELMASNTKTVKDQQNEYDDWIELYNTSSDTVVLAGMFLSDELMPKQKWKVPTKTVIPPKGFLLIWADEDTLDVGGLHANFKLSKSGEAVFLWDTTASIIVDSTVFGVQVDDKSWARIPDGTGIFRITDATPNAPNDKTVSVGGQGASPDAFGLSQNYPNPFNPSTVVGFQLPSASFVSLKVFDVTGREVAKLVEGNKDGGRHEIRWNTTLPSGIYFYRLQVRPLSGGRAGEVVETKKMVLLR